jgi:hypothetical protein
MNKLAEWKLPTAKAICYLLYWISLLHHTANIPINQREIETGRKQTEFENSTPLSRAIA